MEPIFLTIVMFAVYLGVARRYGMWSIPSFILLMVLVGIVGRSILVQMEYGYRFFGVISVDHLTLPETVLQAFLGFLAMALGMLLASLRLTRQILQPNTYPQFGQISFYYLVLALLVVVTAQVTAYTLAYGSLQNALSVLGGRSISESSVGTFAKALTLVGAPLLIGTGLLAAVQKRRLRRFLAVFLYLVLIPWFALTDGRGMVIVILLASALVWKNQIKVFLGLRAGALGAFAVFATTVIGLAWRRTAQNQGDFVSNLSEGLGEGLEAVSEAMPTVDALTVAKNYVASQGHDFGQLVLDAFLVLIPRDFWPDKPIFFPQKVGGMFTGNYSSGLPVGLMGEGYIGFAEFGILFYCLLFGVLIGALENYTRKSNYRLLIACWITFIAVQFSYTSVRTGIQGGVIGLQIGLIAGIPIYAAHRLMPRRRAEQMQPAMSRLRASQLSQP